MIAETKQRIEQIQRGEVPEKYRKRATGIVPCDWAEYSLGEIYKERKLAGDPKLPILTVSIHSGVSDGTLTEDELGKKVKRIEDKTQYKTAKAGDLVFNMMRAWQGAIGVARSDGLVSPAYIVAKPEPEVYPLFMEYFMKLPRMVNTLHRQSYGVTDFRLRLYWDSFAQIKVSLPPLAEQERIAKILLTQDTAIEMLGIKIKRLNLLKKCCLNKLFPKRDESVPEIRFPGVAGSWEQRKLGDLFTKNDAKNTELIGTERTISVASMTWNPLGNGAVAESLPEYKVLRYGDIAFEGNRTKGHPYGKLVVNDIGSGIMSSRFRTLKPKGTICVPFWKYYLTNKSIFTRVLLKATKRGTLMNELVLDDLFEQTVSIPCEPTEQERIGALFASLDNLITLHQRKCELEKQKKKALMQLLLTGIVRVNDMEGSWNGI